MVSCRQCLLHNVLQLQKRIPFARPCSMSAAVSDNYTTCGDRLVRSLRGPSGGCVGMRGWCQSYVVYSFFLQLENQMSRVSNGSSRNIWGIILMVLKIWSEFKDSNVTVHGHLWDWWKRFLGDNNVTAGLGFHWWRMYDISLDVESNDIFNLKRSILFKWLPIINFYLSLIYTTMIYIFTQQRTTEKAITHARIASMYHLRLHSTVMQGQARPLSLGHAAELFQWCKVSVWSHNKYLQVSSMLYDCTILISSGGLTEDVPPVKEILDPPLSCWNHAILNHSKSMRFT